MGVGIDLVELARVARLLERKGERALARLLTAGERAYLATRADVVPHLAARIVAKEALFKAMQSLPGGRAVGWRDLEVLRAESGRPSVALHGQAARIALAQGGLQIHLSLTHTVSAAAAIAVVESP